MSCEKSPSAAADWGCLSSPEAPSSLPGTSQSVFTSSVHSTKHKIALTNTEWSLKQANKQTWLNVSTYDLGSSLKIFAPGILVRAWVKLQLEREGGRR